MRSRGIIRRTVVSAATLFAAVVAAQSARADLPANTWTRLPCASQPGYQWSALAYVPSRGQLLHWGGGIPKNDVRAFDAAAGDWTSDYPSDAKVPAGVTGITGWGYMMPTSRPAASVVINGVCYDSKRDRLVFTMRHLMAAYDPKTKTWQDLGAKTVMPYPVYDHDWVKNVAVMKQEIPGGPPVYGMGTCYDPVNDEIILFPHFDAKNIALRAATGQITGHYGTFRYSFADNTWRLVSDTFGSEAVKQARAGVIAAMTAASDAMDRAWVLNRKPDAAIAKEIGKQVQAAGDQLAGVKAPDDAKAALAPVTELLKTAAAALTAGKTADASKPLRDALWAMNDALDGVLRVEPPARCAAPMVYDPKNKCIVLFGGQTNVYRSDIGAGLAYAGLNDTWLYDVTTRQWRQLATPTCPPGTRIPLLSYDPQSGLVLLVTMGSKVGLWSLDVAKGEWSLRNEQAWPARITTAGGQGSESPHAYTPMYMGGFDVQSRLFLVVQPENGVQGNYAMKVDLAALPPQPAPAAKPTPPIMPFEPSLAEDAAWVEKLKNLPANTWTAARPPAEPARRDWGMFTVDPARGCVVYFGGGHSSYQCNGVSVYSVGGNKWSNSVGEQNSFVPPNEWEGSTLGHRGGLPTGHQRNTYQTFDGRMYVTLGSNDAMPRNYMFHAERDYVRFYDISRGGVWRDVKIARIDRPAKGADVDLGVHMTDPSGRIMNLSGGQFRCYDVNDNSVVVRAVNPPIPQTPGLGENRSFCYLPDRDQIAVLRAAPKDASQAFEKAKSKEETQQVLFLYDVKENKYTVAPAKHTPTLRPVAAMEYVPEQKALLAITAVPGPGGKSIDEQWVYSFDRADWIKLPDQPNYHCQHPYGQLVWVAKYGVFVNFAGSTSVMRPDFSQLKPE